MAVGNACNAVRSAYSVYPRLGARPIAEVTAPEVLAVLRPIEGRGMNETAHRALQRCGQIFRYAIATGRATRDITSDLRGALAPVVVENRAAITEPAKIGALLRAIDDYIGHPMTLIALKLSPLASHRASRGGMERNRPANGGMARPGSADQDAGAAYRSAGLPGSRHPPRAPQCDRQGQIPLPSLRTLDRPMSVNTVNAALRRLGYARDEMTGHGFRAMACTCLNELAPRRDRTTDGARRAEQGPRGVQLGRAIGGAEKDDAGVG